MAKPAKRKSRLTQQTVTPPSPVADVAQVRQGLDSFLSFQQMRYAATKNPLCVWEALNVWLGSRAVLGSDLCLPPWLTEYLARTSNTLWHMSRTTIPERDLPSKVYSALEFVSRRGVNPFREFIDAQHALQLAIDVLWHLKDSDKVDGAIVSVMDEHPARCERRPKCESVSYSTVARAWRANKRYLLK